MDKFDLYEFNIQIWFKDDEWLYSVIQEFESDLDDDDPDVELLFYGSAETLQGATDAVGTFVSEMNFS